MVDFNSDDFMDRLREALRSIDLRDERWRPRRGEPRPNVDEFKITELPEFNGSADPEVYLEWERKIDRMFDFFVLRRHCLLFFYVSRCCSSSRQCPSVNLRVYVSVQFLRFREMVGSRVLQGESIEAFNEGIRLILNRWSVLQTAIENEWGGRDSHLKAQQLASDVFSWFTQSKEPLYIDDLESILDEGMLSLNVEVEDGSVEEVAEKLMVLHEECLGGNFGSIVNLREAVLKQPAHPRVPQIVNDDEDEDDEDDDENIGNDNSANMDVDIPNSESNMNSVNKSVNGPPPEVAGEADDGWVKVNRKNKGRKN